MLLSTAPALGAAYITGGVAALAIVASVTSTWLTLRHQRSLALDERLLTLRADAYLQLLKHQATDPGYRQLLPPDVASVFNAFASEEVHIALGRVRESRDESPENFARALDLMVSQIRSELQRKQDRGPLNLVGRWQR